MYLTYHDSSINRRHKFSVTKACQFLHYGFSLLLIIFISLSTKVSSWVPMYSTKRSQPFLLWKQNQPIFNSISSDRNIAGRRLQTFSYELFASTNVETATNNNDADDTNATGTSSSKSLYDLGIGKNRPLAIGKVNNTDETDDNSKGSIDKDDKQKDDASSTNADTDSSVVVSKEDAVQFWKAPVPVPQAEEYKKSTLLSSLTSSYSASIYKQKQQQQEQQRQKQGIPEPIQTRRMVARDNEAQRLRGALWDEQHFNSNSKNNGDTIRNGYSYEESPRNTFVGYEMGLKAPKKPSVFYPNIDLSIPDSVYTDDGSVDLVWDLLRWEAYQNQKEQQEPLLVSFLHSTILNHPTLESSLAFLLANRLQSPAIMISTQIQSLILETLQNDPTFRRSLRADMMAVRDRDAACNTLPDVFLYFKGFHALQSHRVAHRLWKSGRQVLAQFIQSQVSQIFQIDIHPNATLQSGIMLDHGTGIVIGETATVGHNCSILHHVTLGGSGKKGVVRHPSIGSGVLLGAGASILGPVTVGDGCQVGAGTLVISDLPAHCVAVGVPARIIGSFIDVTEQPSIGMNQLMDDRDTIITFESDGI